MSLSIGTSTVIQYVVTNPLESPIYVNDAAVVVTIYDSDGVELVGESWPVTLDYVAASDGIYRKTFSPFVNLVEDELYSVVIEVLGTDSLEDKCTSIHRAIEASC